MYAADVIIYTSATPKDELEILECRLQVYDNISNWYNMNKLCINKKKSNVMVIGSKWQSKSLNLDDFDDLDEVNFNRVQRIQNLLARIICDNFDYIHSRGIALVRSLKLQTIRERRDYFLCVLMFKCIQGLAPHYLGNDVTMHVDIHGYDTRSAENLDLYIPRCAREIYKISFFV